MILRTRWLSLAFTLLIGLGARGLTPAVADQYDLYSRLTDNPSFTYHASPADWRDINMYQLFTDRFFDGNSGNNLNRYSTTGVAWYNQSGANTEAARHLFQGGDWAGIKQKLSYLKDMGVNCIWISGVQLNEQGTDKNFTPYHAYHPANFYRCEPMFGTFAELKDLIDTAHSNNIYVVLDVVVNHMADLLKYTDCNCNYEGYCENNCGSLDWWNSGVRFGAPFNGPQYFHNNGTIGDNDWDTYPKYIKGAFLGTEDLKTEDSYVQSQLKQIFKDLIDATDCDGFRVDAIKHMEFDFIRGWADDIRQHAAYRGKTGFLLFGEYFSYSDSTQASYCKDNGYSFNSTLWFPMQQTLKNVFAYEQGTAQLTDRMNARSQYNDAANRLVTFMDNHDVDRIALECGSQWQAKLGPALTFLYLGTPIPCLFYGTEHGFNQGERRNGSPKLGQADFQRECMMNFGFQWGNAYGDKFYASPLYNHIKKLNELRAQYECLRRGTFTKRWDEGSAGIFAFTKHTASQDALVVINTAWNTKTCNPAVNKPNGTVYVNKLNESDTLTVSDGKLNVSIDGKGSKVYIAGQGSSEVSTACDATTLTITYTPGGGPLASPIGGIRMGIGHDGNQGIIDVAMTPSGGKWTYGYALSNATNNVTFWFHDEATPTPTYDNNNNQNWTVDISGCGKLTVDLAWIGNTYHWPYNNEWDAGEELWVNTEAWPQRAVADGEVVYTFNGGSSWHSLPMTFDQTNGNNDVWHCKLGAFPAGTTVRYAVRLSGRNGPFWDNNGGGDYYATVKTGPSNVTYIGGTYHWPYNGSIEPGADLWINIESAPIGAGATGEVVYSVNGSTNWLARGLSYNGLSSSNDQWHVNLGGFSALAEIRYAVKIRDRAGTDHWDNNHFANFLATVNDTASSLRWFGNRVNASAPPPRLGIHTEGLQPVLELDNLKSNGLYGVYRSVDLRNWTRVDAHAAAGPSADVPVTEPTNHLVYYRVEPDQIAGTQIYESEELVISIETWPINGAVAANLIYTLDGGNHWQGRPMYHAGTNGNNDVWTARLPPQPVGTVIRYAIQVIDNEAGEHWDNNNTADYTATVRATNITDFVAPTTGYSPLNLTTTNATLSVTLTASDDTDPAPAIYYTTNGGAPSVASPVYNTPILVTDKGAGVDMTIKFFARDASGNTSTVTTLEVKVNENFTFGGAKPYSRNPTLGRAVANGGITIDGSPADWTTNMLIALDKVNDDPRSLGDNWTMHEAPIDMTHLWAAWDDNYLYLAWQYVDVTDKLDPANAGSAAGGKISNNDGILQWIAIDTKPGGATKDMWNKNNGANYWAGSDLPDFQMYMAGSLWQGYISRATNNVFPVDDGGVNYKTCAAAGISYAKGNTCGSATLWGVNDCDNRNDGEPTRDFRAEGHDITRDSFYETRIPLTWLQITRADIESTGLGVMMGAGSMSCMDSLPNDPTTTDTAGVEVWNSSKEWSDTDSFTTPFARVGAGK